MQCVCRRRGRNGLSGANLAEKMGPVVLPLYHSKGAPNEGVYKARFNMQGKDIDVIVDSASADLIVVGETCQSDQCQVTAGLYPTDAKTYTGEESDVSYGSQSDHLRWVNDEVSFVKVLWERPSLENFGAGFQDALQGASGSPMNGADLLTEPKHKLKVGVITRNTSHTVQGGTQPGRAICGIMAYQNNPDKEGYGILDGENENQTSFINQVITSPANPTTRAPPHCTPRLVSVGLPPHCLRYQL